jgi:broad specificity phosphatase PhoE
MRNLKQLTRLVASTAVVAFAAASTLAAQTTTVILVRHGEKAAAPAADPPLTAEGEARAKDLWAAVKDAGVNAIISTQFLRTKGTIQPTATALGLTPEIVSAGGANHPQAVADAIKKHAGQTVLVSGHSNTVPAIIAALGAPKPADICELEYDNLYIVTLGADGKARLIRTKFGTRTVDTTCAAMK